MEKKSFGTLARRFSTNHVRISRKGGKAMKKLVKGLMALTVVMGITTSAHADGWLRVSPGSVSAGSNPITGIVAVSGRTILNVANNGCGATPINFYQDDSAYAQAVLLINRASIEGKKMDIWVSCSGTDARGGGVIFIQ